MLLNPKCISAYHLSPSPILNGNLKEFISYFRHALEDSLERAFVPGLAAVISFIDVRKNLELMADRGPLPNIWLEIFRQCDLLGLQVDPQTLVSCTR